MNSWKSSELGACTPPLRTLKCGTGSDGVTPSGVSHRHSGTPAESARARASAIEVPTVALAPSLLLFQHRRQRGGLSGSRTAVIAGDPLRGEGPAPEHPGQPPVTDLA